MYEGNSVAVVVPAYNEEAHIGSVLEEMPEYVDRIYPVDDCSTDRTWEVIKEHLPLERSQQAATDERLTARADGGAGQEIIPLRHEENRGVGAAITTGYKRSLADGVDVVAVMNGDGQMDPDVLERLVAPVVDGRAGYAKGDRLVYKETRSGMPLWRLFGNAVLTFMTKLSSGYLKMNDPQNGYTVISRRALERIPLDRLYTGYGFLNDLLYQLNVHDIPVAHVPHSAVYGDEESGISYSSFVPSLSLLLLGNFLKRLTVKHLVRDFHPLVFCYLFGTLGILTAMMSGLLVTVSLIRGSASLVVLLATVAVLVISGLTLSVGMAFDVYENGHLERHIR